MKKILCTLLIGVTFSTLTVTNTKAATNNTVSVAGYTQENSYYDGPAAVKNVVQKINGSSLSQTGFANSMGTNSSAGTYVDKVSAELRYRTGFNYVTQSIYATRTLSSAVVSAIDSGYIPIYSVDTKTLNSNYSFSSGHYVVGTGYDYGTSSTVQSVQYYDVYGPMSGYKWISLTKMENAIKAHAGLYVW